MSTGLFEQVESVDEGTLTTIPDDKKKPTIGSPEWTDYVTSLLVDGEYIKVKEKKLPKAEALRRVTTQVYGKILKSKAHPPQVFFSDKGMVSIVNHELIVERYADEGVKEVWGVADVREECLTFPFSQHVTANASTKALGRAYRDLLELQVCVAEELNNVGELVVVEDPEDALPADGPQKKAIISTCKRLSIDVDKFISFGVFKHSSIDKVLKGTGRKMMSMLNGYQAGEKIPVEILIEKEGENNG